MEEGIDLCSKGAIGFTHLGIGTVILRPDRDVHVGAAEADVRKLLGGFAMVTKLVKKVASGAVVIKLEAFLQTNGSLAFFPLKHDSTLIEDNLEDRPPDKPKNLGGD